MAAKRWREWARAMRPAAIVCAPALIALGGLAAVDVGATRLDSYSRSQLGGLYERPDFSEDASESDDNLAAHNAGDETSEDGSEPEAQDSEVLDSTLVMPEAPSSVSLAPSPPVTLKDAPPESSPVFDSEAGELGDDPHSTFIYEQFNPLGYGSISSLSEEAFASGLVERRWRMLDPAIRNRIWLRSLYPYPRMDEGSKEIAGVLTATGLNSHYQRIGSTFELLARAAVAGNPDDGAAFLVGYRNCISDHHCEGYDFYERAVGDIHDVYALPAALLLAKGHCVRARYLNETSLRMLRAVDPPRFAARALVNRIYMLSAIAEQEQCPGQHPAVALAIHRELFGDETPATEPDAGISPLFRASSWQGHLRNLYLYTHALAQFRLHNFAEALATLDAIGDRRGQTLHDMASLMRVRALFELANTHVDTAASAQARMKAIVADMRPTSLRTDANEYLADVDAAMLARGGSAPAPGAPP